MTTILTTLEKKTVADTTTSETTFITVDSFKDLYGKKTGTKYFIL